MAKELNKVDVVMVGVGFTGGIAAAECCKAGLKVVGLERGSRRTVEDFGHMHDEWRYALNYGLMQDLSKETITFRNTRDMRPLPMRRLGSFLVGEGTGGAGVHWNGMNVRFFPYDFKIKTYTDARYGKDKLSGDYLLQDWALSYDELEPYYDKFEKTIGCAGEAKSPFDGPRSSPYPLPPHVKTPVMEMFENSTKNLGYHPYIIPAGIASKEYTNPDGEELFPCPYCGFCERFGCEYDAKASPVNTVIPTAEKTGNFDLRTHCNVVEVLKKGKKVTGVRYVNVLTMEEFIQPADVVLLSGYVLNNAKLLMLAKIGKQYDPKTGRGTLGRNYCYQLGPGGTGFFKDEMNMFAGAGALGMGIDDLSGDNFNHSSLDFVHGGIITVMQTGRRPVANNDTPGGTASFGSEYKKAINYYFNRFIGVGAQGASMPHKDNYLSLDDVYKDAYGLPLLRMTYNFTDQDRALYRFMNVKIEEIIKEMGAISVSMKPDMTNYNIVPYQSTHNTGGTVAGKDPKNSVVNSYMQHWDAENLFVVGAGNFAHNGGCNPTATVGALAYRCAEGIIKYSRSGGSLV